MSEAAREEAKLEAAPDEYGVCATCGIAQVDDTKLEECDGCDLVKHCSDKCRENHIEQHEEEFKKRLSCTTKIYSSSLTALIKGNARSASCRCRLEQKNLHFIHAAANQFAKAVIMLITKAVGPITAHSIESRL